MRKMKNQPMPDNDIIYIDGVGYKKFYYDGIPTSYYISPDGLVYNDSRSNYLKPRKYKGYWIVTLSMGKISKSIFIHRLVAMTYIGPKPGDGYQVDHKDGNKDNNHYKNLEWVTSAENTRRAWKMGLVKARCGDYSPVAKFSDEEIARVILDIKNGIITMSEGIAKLAINPTYFKAILKGEYRKGIMNKLGLTVEDIDPSISKINIRLPDSLINDITYLRKYKRLSYSMISNITGVSKSTVGKVVRGFIDVQVND